MMPATFRSAEDQNEHDLFAVEYSICAAWLLESLTAATLIYEGVLPTLLGAPFKKVGILY